MRKAFFIAFALLLAGSASHMAFAHTFKTDGTITVLMHSNPDDDPVAGQPAGLLFGVTDTAKKFDASACSCTVTISDGGSVLLSKPLLLISDSNPSLYSFTMPFTFPKRAVYQIAVAGAPKIAGAFQTFKVTYDLRVDGTSASSTPEPGATGSPHAALVLYALAAILVIALGIFIWKRRTARR